MPNSLGSLGSFVEQPPPPAPEPGKPLIAPRFRLPSERYTLQEVATFFKDAEAALARLEKNHGKIDPAKLIAQIRNEILQPLCGEFVQLKRLETRKILESMMRPEWRRQAVMFNLNMFEAVSAARLLTSQITTVREEDFAGVARMVLDVLKANWPKEEFPSDPVCPKGS